MESVTAESILVPVVTGSVGGAVFLFLLLLCICLTCKSRSHTDADTLRTYCSQPVEVGEGLDSEPDYMDTPSEASRASYTNVEMPGLGEECGYNDGSIPSENSSAIYSNVEIPEDEENECDEGDYVNMETLVM
ncbi:hypothetical protein AAFF_G00260080 [Aldrovandia affinis]|uniref:Uncharacterized protein n=1 Tax=Aldrovandia affinis TaxID=143900 RepID=A0AAD7W2P4_9TELE|nr:hypothetical protein AAFF_G00260080 [Aldrovandia affinis]